MKYTERDEDLLRYLNAAANLYGVLTIDEFIGMYNDYAKSHDAPMNIPTNEAEITDVIKRMTELNACETYELVDTVWCGEWCDKKTGVRYLVYSTLLEEETEEDSDELIRKMRAKWVVPDLRVLPEDILLAYQDPNFGEECSEVAKLAVVLARGLSGDDLAEMDAFGAQSEMRVNGASVEMGLDYIAESSDYQPSSAKEYVKLTDALADVVRVTRCWNYRGHTQEELVKAGRLPSYPEQVIPPLEEIFELATDEDDEYVDEMIRQSAGTFIDTLLDEDADVLGETLSMPIDDLPPAEFTGPIDFAFVKDPVRREKAVSDYQRVQKLTQLFKRTFVLHEMTPEERQSAYCRLGFDKNPPMNDFGGLVTRNRRVVADDFGSLMDDQHGEPAIRRLLTQGLMDEHTRKSASYFANYRYTWLEVLALKAGVGMKCRDLLTGEELFLMECSMSQSPSLKGQTLCCGIAPIGEVYMALSLICLSDFENPSVILKIVLTHLGLSTERPITLSFAEQADFAAETIRRLDANGKFGNCSFKL